MCVSVCRKYIFVDIRFFHLEPCVMNTTRDLGPDDKERKREREREGRGARLEGEAGRREGGGGGDVKVGCQKKPLLCFRTRSHSRHVL